MDANFFKVNVNLKNRIFLWGLFLLIFLNGCKKDVLKPSDEEIPEDPFRAELLELVNAYRQTGCDCGGVYFAPVEPVVWNDLLELAAKNHTKDMEKGNFFSHTGSDGNNPAYRIKAVGYNASTWGENIAKGYPTAKSAVQGWIKSEGHCKNIMNPAFQDMGVAVKGTLWTQVFGKKK